MKIHEYQAKELLRGYGVAVPRGKLVQSAEEAVAAARELMAGGKAAVVVKAQIHAGGRGKGGGVKLARSPQDAEKLAGQMLGMTLVTHQTGPEGRGGGRVVDGGGSEEAARVVFEHRARPRRRKAGDHGERRRRHG